MIQFSRATIDEADLAKYDRLGEEWWNPKGPMAALHKFNPVRVGWISERMAGRAEAARGPAPLDGVKILDVGCGGGILSESLARLGANVVGIDPAPNNIVVAGRHAEAAGVAVDYRCTTVEEVARTDDRFDAVLIMEVVEHVRDVPGFVRDAARCLAPGGTLFGATINRTFKSYGLAIVGAEYVLRWLPRGTHNWHQFVTPDEFREHMRHAGLTPNDEAGVVYNPLRDSWQLSRDMGCNYMLAARAA